MDQHFFHHMYHSPLNPTPLLSLNAFIYISSNVYSVRLKKGRKMSTQICRCLHVCLSVRETPQPKPLFGCTVNACLRALCLYSPRVGLLTIPLKLFGTVRNFELYQGDCTISRDLHPSIENMVDNSTRKSS